MTVQPLTVKTAPVPITANMAGMVSLFGICETTIRTLAAEGVIRRAKLGDTPQAATVYFVADMVEYLAAQTIETPNRLNILAPESQHHKWNTP
jgi:hypothetical protein